MGESVTRRQLKFHHEASRGQACEFIEAVCICDSCTDLLCSRGIEQIHQYPGNTCLICILNAVLICVIPNKIPETCRRYARNRHSSVCTQIVLARGERDAVSPARFRVCIAVRGVISLVLRREFISRRQFVCHRIRSRGQTCKFIESFAVCLCLGDDRPVSRICQHDAHAGNPLLICILNAILICVIPYKITETGRPCIGNEHARVHGHVVLTR